MAREARDLRRLPAAGAATRGRRLRAARRFAWRRSGRRAAARLRALDAELLDDHALCESASRFDGLGLVAALAAHVRLVRVFLRAAAPFGLSIPRSKRRPLGLARNRQTPLHHDRPARAADARPARRDLDVAHDAPSRQALDA